MLCGVILINARGSAAAKPQRRRDSGHPAPSSLVCWMGARKGHLLVPTVHRNIAGAVFPASLRRGQWSPAVNPGRADMACLISPNRTTEPLIVGPSPTNVLVRK